MSDVMKQGKTTDKLGITYYYKDDKLHRDNDLPAVEYPDGTKQWFNNGERHRLTGPSGTHFTGVEVYYINNKHLTKEQHANHPEVKKYKLQQILNRIIKE